VTLVNRDGDPLAPAEKGTIGCVVCGRGSLKLALPNGQKVDTSLIQVACTDTNAHLPGGSHEGKCVGVVYRHNNGAICVAVKRQSRN
jgi:hypothetical protein